MAQFVLESVIVQGLRATSESVAKSYKMNYVSPDAMIGSGAVIAHISSLVSTQNDTVLGKNLTILENCALPAYEVSSV